MPIGRVVESPRQPNVGAALAVDDATRLLDGPLQRQLKIAESTLSEPGMIAEGGQHRCPSVGVQDLWPSVDPASERSEVRAAREEIRVLGAVRARISPDNSQLRRVGALCVIKGGQEGLVQDVVVPEQRDSAAGNRDRRCLHEPGSCRSHRLGGFREDACQRGRQFKRRGRGRPGRGAEPMQVVAVRLTAEEPDALDQAASGQHMSRSEAIRAALGHSAACATNAPHRRDRGSQRRPR